MKHSRRGFLRSMFATAAVVTGLARSRLELVDDPPARFSTTVYFTPSAPDSGVVFGYALGSAERGALTVVCLGSRDPLNAGVVFGEAMKVRAGTDLNFGDPVIQLDDGSVGRG